jgi:pimeloyl-ACP methyl ester carboxylesterase
VCPRLNVDHVSSLSAIVADDELTTADITHGGAWYIGVLAAPATMKQVASDVTSGSLEGVGHYAALEAPERVAKAIREFVEQVSSKRVS